MRRLTTSGLAATALALVLAASMGSLPEAPAVQNAESGYALAEGGLEFEVRADNWHDQTRARTLPVRIYMPQGDGPFPVVVYSHDFGGSRGAAAFLGAHWATHGIASVFLQHPGSDTGLWPGGSPASYRQARIEAAGDEQLIVDRSNDVSFAIDEIGRRAEAGELAFDPGRIGLASQGEGARVTLAALGRSLPGEDRVTDQRIRAGVVISPAPLPDGTPATEADALYGNIDRPVMHIAGTADAGAVDPGLTAQDRLSAFNSIPSPGQYAVVFEGGDASVFNDPAVTPRENYQDYENIQSRTAQMTTVMWQAFLINDPGARAWLDGDGFAQALRDSDRLERRLAGAGNAAMY